MDVDLLWEMCLCGHTYAFHIPPGRECAIGHCDCFGYSPNRDLEK